MYNTKLVCTYKEKDDGETDDLYRKEMLLAFYLDDFDDDKINLDINQLYNILKNNEDLLNCMKKMAIQFMSEDLLVGLMGLFSYDYFYLLHPCICEMIEQNSISEDNIAMLKKACNV